jgi:hypothetical protein
VPELNLCQFALTKRWDKLERETAKFKSYFNIHTAFVSDIVQKIELSAVS